MATRRPVLHPVHHLSGQLSSLTNFAEFLAFRALSSPVLCRGAIASDYIGPGPEGLEPEFFVTLALQFFAHWPCSLRVGQNRMLGLGLGLLFVLNAGTAGHILVPAAVNWLM